VDRICSNGIEIVMSQVDDMSSARGNGAAKTGIILKMGGLWHFS